MTGRTRGGSVHAGSLGYSSRGESLVRSDGGGIRAAAARLAPPRQPPVLRLEVADANVGKAWTNPL